MSLAQLSKSDPITIEVASAIAGLTFFRSDLSNSISVIHTSANLLTFSSTIAATQFNGSGAGLTATSVPIASINATGTKDNTTFLRGDGTWAVPSGGSSPTIAVDWLSASDYNVLMTSETSGNLSTTRYSNLLFSPAYSILRTNSFRANDRFFGNWTGGGSDYWAIGQDTGTHVVRFGMCDGNAATWSSAPSNMVIKFDGKISSFASSATQAGLNVPNGVPPFTPSVGDIWAVDGALFYRGTSSTFTLTSAGGGLSLSSVLTGFVQQAADNTPLADTDTLLQGFQKLQSQIDNKLGITGTNTLYITKTSNTAFLVSTRYDLPDTIYFNHSSAGVLTVSATITATTFTGNGLTPAAIVNNGIYVGTNADGDTHTLGSGGAITNSISDCTGGVGGGYTILTGNGGGASSTGANPTGGNGGDYYVRTGYGGNATTGGDSAVGGRGGNITFELGNGGNGSSGSKGSSGTFSVITGTTFVSINKGTIVLDAGTGDCYLQFSECASSPSVTTGRLYNLNGVLSFSGNTLATLSGVQTITYAATLDLDISTFTASVIRIELTGPCTINLSGGSDGQRFTLELVQDGTGGRVVTLGTGIGYGTDITSYSNTTTLNKRDVLGFHVVSSLSKAVLIGVAKGY